jgi:hypothetical protein
MNDNLKKMLFIDVETVAQTNTYEELDLEWQKLWSKQCQSSYRALLDSTTMENNASNGNGEDPFATLWKKKAAIHPEFGNIVCIVMGFLSETEGKVSMRVKPIFGESEAEMISQFSTIAAKFDRLCAYNGKKFDFPYIARRSIINGLAVPDIISTWGKKPWEIENIDPMELWQFGGQSYPSMDLLCKNLGIPVKSIMDGSEVHDAFYVEKAYQKIARYCAGDVIALAKLFLKLTEGSTEISDIILAQG